MSSGALLLSALLTASLSGSSVAAPSNPTSNLAFESNLADVTIEDGDLGVELIAYDDAGGVIGLLMLWVDDGGDVHIASEYDDGYADVVIIADVPHVQADLPLATVEARARLISDVVASTGTGPQESWFTCGLRAGLAVAACSGAGLALVAGCPTASAYAACECLPLMVEKWKHKKC